MAVSVDTAEFKSSVEKATAAIIRGVYNNMEKACLTMEVAAKKECPIDNGPLRASITHEIKLSDKELVGSVGATMKYAAYVHQGTGIYAKDGKGRMTPWKWKAESGKYKGWHITRGQKPNPFLERARDSTKDKIANLLGGV